jgi:hypothetical protein
MANAFDVRSFWFAAEYRRTERWIPPSTDRICLLSKSELTVEPVSKRIDQDQRIEGMEGWRLKVSEKACPPNACIVHDH